jgi:alanyl-tRNA synthetase
MKYSEDIITIFLNKTNNGIMIMAMLGPKPAKETVLDFGTFVNEIASQFGGKGGGKKDYGQGFVSNNKTKAEDIVKYAIKRLKSTGLKMEDLVEKSDT